jgi:hypothetical protein
MKNYKRSTRSGALHVSAIFRSPLATALAGSLLAVAAAHAQAPGQPFHPSEPISADVAQTREMLVADVDNDFDLDAIDIKEDSLNHVFLNDGTGVLSGALPIGIEPDDVSHSISGVVVDIDHDTLPDLVIANSNATLTVPSRVYLGNGDGTFGAGSDLDAMNFDSRAVAAADLNGDGNIDLVIANYGSPNRIYLGDGLGGFTYQGDVSADNFQTRDVLLVDFNGDTLPDLLEGNFGEPNVLYLGDGVGGFLTGTALSGAGRRTRDVAVADLDADGDLDIVEANINDVDRYFLNDGTSAVFTAVDLSAPAGRSRSADIADVDGDTFPDIVIASDSVDDLLYLGDGAGNFAAPVMLTAELNATERVVLADMDGDLDKDVVLGIRGNVNDVYQNDSMGSFTLASTFATDNLQTFGAAFGDVDGDGDLDVLEAKRDSSPDRLYLNDGAGTFAEGTPVTGDYSTNSVLFVDVDNANGPDIVEANGGEVNRVYLNDGSGGFGTGTDIGVDMDVSRDVAAGDLNGDGWVDLVFANTTGSNRAYFNDGAGGFPAATDLPGFLSSTDIAVGDMDGDGDLDVVLGNYGTNNRVLFNDGSGAFTSVVLSSDLRGTRSIALADLDGDGDLDVVTGNGPLNGPADEARDRVYFNDGTGAFPSAVDLTLDPDNTQAVAVGDVDDDGDVDIVTGNIGGTNRLYLNDGSGGFSAGVDVSSETLDTRWIGLGDVNGSGNPDLLTSNEGEFGRLQLNGNPTTSGLSNISATEDDPPVDVDLFPAFADREDADAALTYTVAYNSNPGLVQTGIAGGMLTITFVADASGTATLRVRATDTTGLFAEAALDVNVSAASDSPALVTPIADQAGSVDSAFALDVSVNFTDADGDALTYSQTGLPASLGIDPASGQISGTLGAPDLAGSPFSVTVTADSGQPGETAATDTFSLTVSDDTPPDITVQGSNPVTVEAGTAYTDAGATATDNVDGDVTGQITTDNPVDTGVPGTYTVTYDVTDAGGNTATATRTVNVEDTTDPVITVTGPNPVLVEINSAYADAGATASDSLDGDLTPQIVVDNPVDTSTLGQYTVTYTVSDAAGNTATATRSVNVGDSTAPIITVVGQNPATVALGAAYVDEGATAADDVDGDLTGQIVTDNPVDTSTAGTYTVTYTVADASGNGATATRTVNVVIVDTTPPVITLEGSDPETVEGGSTYTDAGATATDLVDGDLTDQISVGSDVDTSQVGSYTVTYSVTDASGNTATATRTVDVVDTTPPTITVLNRASVTINQNQSYVDAGATASDAVDGDLTDQITVNNPVNTASPRTYTVTYTVTDASGNMATATRTVTVKAVDSGGGGAGGPLGLLGLLLATLAARRERVRPRRNAAS